MGASVRNSKDQFPQFLIDLLRLWCCARCVLRIVALTEQPGVVLRSFLNDLVMVDDVFSRKFSWPKAGRGVVLARS